MRSSYGFDCRTRNEGLHADRISVGFLARRQVGQPIRLILQLVAVHFAPATRVNINFRQKRACLFDTRR